MDADTQPTDIQATEVCFFAERGCCLLLNCFVFLSNPML